MIRRDRLSREGPCRLSLGVLTCVLWAVAPAAPQKQQDSQAATLQEVPPTFRVESNLVVVDVTVRDRRGSLVTDLRREDFVVYEDNVKQEIATFSLENIPTALRETTAEEKPGPPASPEPAPVNLSATPRTEWKPEDLENKRLIVLFFDLSSLTTEDLTRSIAAARDFVTSKSTPHDLVAIASYSSTLRLAQNLTNDRDTLLKTLDQLEPTEAGDAPEENLGDADTSGDTYVPDDVQFNIFNTDRRLSALETLAKAFREFPERKSLIYFSSGMSTTGVENQSQIRSTVDKANQSNMSIYTVDSRGLMALPPGGDASKGSPGGQALFSGNAVTRQLDNQSDSQETLTTLAHDTGGVAFQDTNDLAPVFTKVQSETRSYYVLGYYPSNTKEDGRFRKIRVEVSRPQLRVQSRPGYFAAKQFIRLTQAERDRQLEEAFTVDRPFSDLPLILEADSFKGEGPTTVLPVSIQIAGDAVHFEAKRDQREAQFEFLAQITDPKGRVAGVARDIVQVRLPAKAAEKIRTGQIMYTTGFELRPGDYALKFLVRDNWTGKFGTFEQPLSVPALDGKSLQTSSIVLGSRLVDAGADSQGVERHGFGDRFPMLAAKTDPLKIGGKRIVPSIGNVFLRSQTLYVYFEVYGAAEDRQTRRPSLETYLLFLCNNEKVRESETYHVTEWLKDRKAVALIAMAIPLQGLRRDAYTLQIHLQDNISDADLFRRVPLVIK
jgi:VWFA-related protein